jgi:hypothetical protein
MADRDEGATLVFFWPNGLGSIRSPRKAFRGFLHGGAKMKVAHRSALGLLSTALAFVLASCAYTDHFDDRSGTYGTMAAQSRDRMILTNVLRASHGEPLSFVSVGAINGISSAQSTFGLPPLVFGPHVAAASSGLTHALQGETIFGGSAGGGNGFVGNSVNALASTNFQVTPVETKEFYEGLLRNVDPRILQLFVEQGIARELLFYLFTDRIIVEKAGKKVEFRNDPLDPKFGAFQRYVKLAIDYGLASEPQPHRAKAPAGDSNKKTTAADGPEVWQLCFDDLHRAKNVPEAGDAPKCGGKTNSGEERTVSFKSPMGETEKLTVMPRSPFGIFQYLGRIAASGETGRIKLQSDEAIDEPPFRDEVLFEVVSGTQPDCYLSVSFKGQDYCVPEGAINSKRILGLLTQLIALNTAISDVPVTPSVRLIQ